MAVKYDIFESPVCGEGTVGIPHPKVLTAGVVGNSELGRQICYKSTVSPADVEAVVTALAEEMAQAMKDSYSVHIEGIGFFRLVLKCRPGTVPQRITPADVRLKAVKFTPDKEFMEKLSALEFRRHRDEARHSLQLTQEELMVAVDAFFRVNRFMRRADLEAITGFNAVKAIRTIRKLTREGWLMNVGTRYQPLYVKGDRW